MVCVCGGGKQRELHVFSNRTVSAPAVTDARDWFSYKRDVPLSVLIIIIMEVCKAPTL